MVELLLLVVVVVVVAGRWVAGPRAFGCGLERRGALGHGRPNNACSVFMWGSGQHFSVGVVALKGKAPMDNVLPVQN